MGVSTPDQQHQQPASRQGRQGRERADRGAGAVSGNLTRDPELRYTPSGKAVVSMRVASSERVRNEHTGEWEDGQTTFYDVTAWGQLAENCSEHLSKGMRIVADGRWEEQTWEAADGEERAKVVLVARDAGPSMAFFGARVLRSERAPR